MAARHVLVTRLDRSVQTVTKTLGCVLASLESLVDHVMNVLLDTSAFRLPAAKVCSNMPLIS